MKLLKRILKIIFTIIAILTLAICIILGIDKQNTNYLKVKKNAFAHVNSYLITNVNIIPMHRDTILANKTLYIKDGIIQTITDHVDSNDIDIIDGKNKYLMPGLIDMHVHVWDKYELGLYLSSGVTAVRNLWGMPMHIRLKEAINNNDILAPTFFTTGPKLTGPEFIGDDNLNLTSPEYAKEKVISYKNRGYDFIKTYYGLTEPIYNAVIEQATHTNMDIVAHPSQKVPYSYHFNPQIKSIEHAEEIVQQPLNYTLDTLKLKTIINEFAHSTHAAFCPTLIVYHNIFKMLNDDAILDSEALQYINPLIKEVDSEAQFERWYNTKIQDSSIVRRIKDQHNFHLKTVKAMHEAGVTIICGTDSGIGVTVPGVALHQELAFYKEAGLSNYEVLKTATVNASKTHTIMNNMGTIETGKVANLILTDKNPLQDLSVLENPDIVFIKGKKLNRETLTTFKNEAKNRKNFIASAARYLENLVVEK